MKKIDLSEDQIQLLIDSQEAKIKQQEAKIKELENKVSNLEHEHDFEWRSKSAFMDFIESLGKDKMVECIKFMYAQYGQCDFTKDTLDYWHDEKIDISDIKESGNQFKPWPPEKKI